MVDKWVFIECRYKNKWINPIISAIRENISASDLEPFEDSINKLAHAISTRLDMIDYIEGRMRSNLFLIEKELLHLVEDNISTRDSSGCAHYIDDKLKYDTLIDIDSFIFEINACCDLIGYLAEIIGSLFRSDTTIKGSIICKSILTEGGESNGWFPKLDKSRNDFIHETAPYIAIDVTHEGHYNLLIMKENLKSFDDCDKYITLTDLIDIKNGFYKSLQVLQSGLIELVKRED